jgi:tRNA(Glu) U13 pseudouridine synthase TruD
MRLKEQPEDFVVEEILEKNVLAGSSGAYGLYILRKRLWNTEDCLQWLAKGLNKERRDFGVGGNKDRHAITSQYLTIKNAPVEVRGYDAGGGRWFTLDYVGRVSEPLRLGVHARNRFSIVVRDLDGKWEGKTPVLVPIRNRFGEQRFSEYNDIVGMHLVRKEYREAAKVLGLSFTSDAISALRTVPKHTRLLYVHAAQSRLWNALADTLPLYRQRSVPIPGYGSEGEADLLEAMDAILAQHHLTTRSFVNPSMPELSVEGGARQLLQDVQEFTATRVRDGTCTISFILAPGQYATETVRQLFADTNDTDTI